MTFTKTLFVLCAGLFSISLHAQDTLRLKKAAIESLFLQQNLELLAEKLEIDKAEAAITQARLWPNPELSIDEVNFWTPKGALDPHNPVIGPLIGNWGEKQQFVISIEQLILTAGKRKKSIDLERINRDKSVHTFETLLRDLKLVLNRQLHELMYYQSQSDLYNYQLQQLKPLLAHFNAQVEKGVLARTAYVRLKSLELESLRNQQDVQQQIASLQKDLSILLRIPATTHIVISDDELMLSATPQELVLEDLISTAKANRPDFKHEQLNIDYSNKLLDFEKAQRVPNLTVRGGYDRASNMFNNFVGFGVSVDLPFFNKNQGNIQAAKVGIEQSKLQLQLKEHTIESEAVAAYQQYRHAFNFYSNIDQAYNETLDNLLNAHQQLLINKKISLLEYIDFYQSYIENKNIQFEAIKQLLDKKEELNYTIGKEIIK